MPRVKQDLPSPTQAKQSTRLPKHDQQPLQRGSITMTIAHNLNSKLGLHEIESLATRLGMTIRHCQEENCIMKYKLAISIAEELLQDDEHFYI